MKNNGSSGTITNRVLKTYNIQKVVWKGNINRANNQDKKAMLRFNYTNCTWRTQNEDNPSHTTLPQLNAPPYFPKSPFVPSTPPPPSAGISRFFPFAPFYVFTVCDRQTFEIQKGTPLDDWFGAFLKRLWPLAHRRFALEDMLVIAHRVRRFCISEEASGRSPKGYCFVGYRYLHWEGPLECSFAV